VTITAEYVTVKMLARHFGTAAKIHKKPRTSAEAKR